MLALLGNLIPPQYRILAAVLIAVAVFGAGATTGYCTRDYFADRKEVRQLKDTVASWQSAAKTWGAEREKLTQRALAAEAARQANQTQAANQSAAVDPAKLTKIIVEKCDAQTNTIAVEHTDPCHWLQLNAAYAGTAAPAQCSRRLPEELQDQHLPAAGVDREGN